MSAVLAMVVVPMMTAVITMVPMMTAFVLRGRRDGCCSDGKCGEESGDTSGKNLGHSSVSFRSVGAAESAFSPFGAITGVVALMSRCLPTPCSRVLSAKLENDFVNRELFFFGHEMFLQAA